MWPGLALWIVIATITLDMNRSIQRSERVTSICLEVVNTIIQSQ